MINLVEMQYYEFHLYLICKYPLHLVLIPSEHFLCISELIQ